MGGGGSDRATEVRQPLGVSGRVAKRGMGASSVAARQRGKDQIRRGFYEYAAPIGAGMGATQKSLIPVWGGERGCLSKPNGALDGTHAGFGLGGWMTGVLSGGTRRRSHHKGHRERRAWLGLSGDEAMPALRGGLDVRPGRASAGKGPGLSSGL